MKKLKRQKNDETKRSCNDKFSTFQGSTLYPCFVSIHMIILKERTFLSSLIYYTAPSQQLKVNSLISQQVCLSTWKHVKLLQINIKLLSHELIYFQLTII